MQFQLQFPTITDYFHIQQTEDTTDGGRFTYIHSLNIYKFIILNA